MILNDQIIQENDVHRVSSESADIKVHVKDLFATVSKHCALQKSYSTMVWDLTSLVSESSSLKYLSSASRDTCSSAS